MRNIEKLRDYFLGKDPYLRETMADNSLRLIGIPGKNFVLRTELMKEAQERKTKDDELAKAISDEEEARINKDNEIEGEFDNYYTKTQIDDKIVDDVESNKSADDKAASVRALYNFVADIVQPLTQDITIPENEEINPLLLPTGWHTTGDHVVYYGDSLEPVFRENTLFYFNSEHENQLFYVMPANALDGSNQIAVWLWFDTYDNVWQYAGYDIQTTIGDSSTDMSIPTAAAVLEFVNKEKLHHYSTDEQVVGVWTDGKPLYEKTITQAVAGSGYEVVSLTDAKTAFVENCFIEDDDDATYKYTYSVPYRYNNTTWVTATIIKNKGTNDVEIELDNQLSHSVTFYATVRYTKTTD